MGSNDISSINRLLNQDDGNFSLIRPEVIEAGQHIASVLLTAGTEAWGVLLNRGVLYTTGTTDYCLPNDSLSDIDGEAAVTTIQCSGDREGDIHLILPELGAKGVVAYMMALMMGTESSPEETALDEEGMDAYSEAVNNFLGSAAQALRQDIGGSLNLTMQETDVVNMADGAAGLFGSEEMLCHTGQVTIEGMVPVPIYMLMPVSVTGMTADIEKQESHAELPVVTQTAPAAALPTGENKQQAMKIRVPVNVILAEKNVRMEVAKEMAPGSIIEFRKQSGEMLDICAANVKIGEGEVVIINEHFGIQVRRLVDIRTLVTE